MRLDGLCEGGGGSVEGPNVFPSPVSPCNSERYVACILLKLLSHYIIIGRGRLP